jgi:hypothetical protein
MSINCLVHKNVPQYIQIYDVNNHELYIFLLLDNITYICQFLPLGTNPYFTYLFHKHITKRGNAIGLKLYGKKFMSTEKQYSDS